MAKLSKVKRLRILLALLEDGVVPDVTAYDNVELSSPAKTDKYVASMVGDGIGPGENVELTNNQKAGRVLDQVKGLFRQARRREIEREARQVANEASQLELDADFADDPDEEV